MMQKVIHYLVEYGYSAMALVIFLETGLLVFCLPGDSLLFMAGLACVPNNSFLNGANLDFVTLNMWLIPAAIIGDTVGYWIGYKIGDALYKRERTWYFRKEHLLTTRDYYEKHGGKTIVLARFAPILRTFAPVVAGIAQMPYKRFVSYNVFGGIGWILGLTALGYWLGEKPMVKNNLEVALALIIFISLLPAIVTFLKSRKNQDGNAPAAGN